MNKKAVLLGLIAVALVLTVPAARARVDGFFGHVSNLLERPKARLKQPIQNWTAQNDAKHLMRGLAEQERRGNKLPTGRAFQRFARARLDPKRNGLDPWGNIYNLEIIPDSVIIWSAGRDSIPETEDDVRVSQVRQ